jgi:hypothetical protein
MASAPFLSTEMLFPGYIMETIFLQMCPSSISKVWRIHLPNKSTTIRRRGLRIPVIRIINKIIIPILSADIMEVERVYSEKITPFQNYWLDLIQSAHKPHDWKQKPIMNSAFYDRTITMINSTPFFDKESTSIIDTVEILKDFEMNICSTIGKKPRLFEYALDKVDVKDLLDSLYGSFMALLCFWYIERNEKLSGKSIHTIVQISHRFAIKLDGYIDTLDIMTNPEEMEMMKKSAEQWEKHSLQNKAH